jgi:cytochrome d ubiquinol oxidase subunit I
MLFGMKRVGPALHFMATCIVAIGTLMSAFWILSVNSWMQTPAGYTLAPDGRFLPADWWAVIFNPSFPVRLPHMVLASYLSVAFVVGAVGAWHLLATRGRNEGARVMFGMAMWMAAIVAPAQILMGDLHGLNTLKYQPAKIAAMEGDWNAEPYAPEILIGFPDMRAEITRDAVAIPYVGSLILTHRLGGSVPGLKQFKPQDRPDSSVIFWTFRVMVGTEMGRQPYTVYGLLRTADSVSPVGAPGVAASLVAFVLVYAVVFGAGLMFILREMAHAPQPGEPDVPASVPHRAAGIMPGPAVGQVPDAVAGP